MFCPSVGNPRKSSSIVSAESVPRISLRGRIALKALHGSVDFILNNKALGAGASGQQIVACCRRAQRLPDLPRFRHNALNRSFFRGEVILVFV
jgi:hypothetical protein